MVKGVAERPRDLLVAGHVNVDRFITVRAFPERDRTVPVLGTRDTLGGTAANLALVASSFGVATGLVARVGDGFPTEYAERLRKAKVDLRAFVPVRGVGTPTCFTVEDVRGHQRTLIDQGAMAHLEDASVPRAVLRDYSWLHVTTGNPDYHLRLVRAARNLGIRVAVDPAQEIHYWWDRRRFLKLISDAEVLFGNRSEIARAMELCGVGSPERLVDRVPLVIRTEGTRGVTAFGRDAVVHVPAVRAGQVRTIVGAGDAFRGGFYAAWFGGQPLQECLESGTRSAARWVASPGG
jgi:nucleoside kinase